MDTSWVSDFNPDSCKFTIHHIKKLARAQKMPIKLVNNMEEYHDEIFWVRVETQSEIAQSK